MGAFLMVVFHLALFFFPVLGYETGCQVMVPGCTNHLHFNIQDKGGSLERFLEHILCVNTILGYTSSHITL